jgi:hypothetical protein
MIIVKLQGGLGNQMFQYALGRKLSLLHNTALKLDLSFLLDRTTRENFTYRDYNLDIFQLQVEFANQEDIQPFFRVQNYRLINKIYDRLFFFKEHHKYIYEKIFLFNPKIFQITGNIYLDGYWQSEYYFVDIKEIIKKDFTLKPQNLSIQEQELLNIIDKSLSICLHIRRGDLVNNPAANQFHGLIDIEYINNAINIIESRIKYPHYFIFSDDIQWCKKNINLKYPTQFVTGENAEDRFSVDFQLMQACKYFIISNSSFSWWTAWLSQNPDKIVIAPKQWFRNSKINTNDLVPKEWIRI